MVGISINFVLLRVYVFITVSVVLCTSVFLREPASLSDADGEKDAAARRSAREPRAVPDWRADVRRRARTFGQSEDEINRVQFYLKKLKEIAAVKFPQSPYSEKADKDVLQSDTFTQPQSQSLPIDVELNRELKAWSSRRMSDDGVSDEEIINPEEHGRHFEGDIVLLPDQAESLLESVAKEGSRRVKRKFIGSKVRRWDPRKPIYYSFDGSHTIREQRVIELALEHWHNITCLNFERRDDEPKGSRIVFTDVDGCASNVGKHPLGEPQFVSLAPECIRLGVIAHEVAHALGFWHEQSRPDRDYYVNVRWENIDRDSTGQFLKEQPIDVDNGGVPYDYGSIMHYRSKAFARYDDLFTLNTFVNDYQRTIGQRDQLSFNDIRLMNVIYCRDTCPRQLPCQRGGYTDPRKCDRCRCPDGFTGMYCEQVMPGYGAECGGRIEVRNSWARITSPGYPTEFKEGQECSWLLVAPPGYHVQLQFYSEFEMYCKPVPNMYRHLVDTSLGRPCNIVNGQDLAETPMLWTGDSRNSYDKYCCYGTPPTPVYSATTDMLVLFRSFYRGGKGFQARVRAVPHSEFGNWLEWSSFSECSASCGACGTRRRTRLCFPSTSTCLGSDSDTEVCAREPCPKGICPKSQWDESECTTGLLSILKGLGACKNDLPPSSSECTEVCCAGYALVNGLCTRI